MNKTLKVAVGIFAVLFLVITAGFIGYSIKQPKIIQSIVTSNDEPIVAQFGPPTGDDTSLRAVVKGSLYEAGETATVFGSCLDAQSHTVQSDATLSILYANTTKFIDQQNMSEIEVGQFNYSFTVPDVLGTYFIVFNCTNGPEYAMAFGEFQFPEWINKIRKVFSTEQDAFTSELEVTTAFPDEEFRVELTFRYRNGTNVPDVDSIFVEVIDPNENLKTNLTKSDFTKFGEVWQSDISIDGTFVTGLYRFHIVATKGAYTSTAKPVQARVTSGAVFRYALNTSIQCANAENTLFITNSITNEGGSDTETTCQIFLDRNNNQIQEPNEVSAGFSKFVAVGQTVEETAIIRTNDERGVFTLQGICEYEDTLQPPARASETVIIESCGETNVNQLTGLVVSEPTTQPRVSFLDQNFTILGFTFGLLIFLILVIILLLLIMVCCLCGFRIGPLAFPDLSAIFGIHPLFPIFLLLTILIFLITLAIRGG